MPSLSDLTSKCIRCGFCLEACPTFMISGRETESPRGRIYLAKQADEGKIDWSDAKDAFDTCLGCRACEPACPSGVEYGKILDIARAQTGGGEPLQRLINKVSDPSKIALSARIGSLIPGRRIPALAMRGVTSERPVANIPHLPPHRAWPPMDEAHLPPVQGEVYLLEGCAMRVLYPHVHTALRRLLRRVGFVVKEASAGCCGALHMHGGFHEVGVARMQDVFAAMSDDLPIIVDSAGCGSAMKEHSFTSGKGGNNEVFDACEFLFNKGLTSELARSTGLSQRVTYHDACHLAHAQSIKREPRALLQAIPNLDYIELEESDVCCGSAGVYNLTQPNRAKALLDRKVANIAATAAEVVATGNPGCLAWIEQGATNIKVRHTLEVLEASFSGNLA